MQCGICEANQRLDPIKNFLLLIEIQAVKLVLTLKVK